MSSGRGRCRVVFRAGVEPDNCDEQACLPVMLAHSGALRGSIDKRDEQWICGGKYKRPNLHMQRCCSACGVRNHHHGPIAVKWLSAPYEAARTPVFSQPSS